MTLQGALRRWPGTSTATAEAAPTGWTAPFYNVNSAVSKRAFAFAEIHTSAFDSARPFRVVRAALGGVIGARQLRIRRAGLWFLWWSVSVAQTDEHQ